MNREAGAQPVRPAAPEDQLRRLLVELGGAMNAAGAPVNETQERLRTIAAAYGADQARVIALPTFLLLSLGPSEALGFEETRQFGGAVRLDQSAALFALATRAEAAAITPAQGIVELNEVFAGRPRFGPATAILGHVILTVGICLVLRPTPLDLIVAAFFGAAVGLFKAVGGRLPSIRPLVPVLAALGVSALTFTLIRHTTTADLDLRAMAAPLVTFLPGAELATGTIEVAAGEIISGSSRLISGSLQLLLLAVGVISGERLVDGGASTLLVHDPSHLLGAWSPWLGVLVFGIGVSIFFSGPSLPWLCVVLYAAWFGQLIGNDLFGGYVSAFSGALAMTPVAYWVERRASGPPTLVTLLPAFWLLVPGSLGLIGVTELLDANRSAGVVDLLGPLASVAGVALGVLCGYPLDRSASRILALGRRAGFPGP